MPPSNVAKRRFPAPAPPPAAPRRATRVAPRPERRPVATADTWLFLTFFVALMALVTSIVAVGFAARAIDEARNAGAEGAVAPVEPAAPESVAVRLVEMAIEPRAITVAEGGALVVSNEGAVVHNVAVKGERVAGPMLEPGRNATLTLFGLAPGIYTLVCEVAGHEQAGMKATLRVVAPGGQDGR